MLKIPQRIYTSLARVEDAKAHLRKLIEEQLPDIPFTISVGQTKQFDALFVTWQLQGKGGMWPSRGK